MGSPDYPWAETGPALLPDHLLLRAVVFGDCSLPRRRRSDCWQEWVDIRSGRLRPPPLGLEASFTSPTGIADNGG